MRNHIIPALDYSNPSNSNQFCHKRHQVAGSWDPRCRWLLYGSFSLFKVAVSRPRTQPLSRHTDHRAYHWRHMTGRSEHVSWANFAKSCNTANVLDHDPKKLHATVLYNAVLEHLWYIIGKAWSSSREWHPSSIPLNIPYPDLGSCR